MSEVNVAWQHLRTDQRLGQRLQDSFGTSYTQCAWFREYPAIQSSRQYGGCAIVALNSAVGRVVGSGADSSGLGRWCWLRLRGKANTHVRIICAYRPVKNMRDSNSVYNQQKWYYKSINLFDTCPQIQFTIDLESEISRFQADGDKIC